MKVLIGSDHAGYTYKEKIKQLLIDKKITVDDLGPHSEDAVDYPDYAHAIAEHISSEKKAMGILVCNSGQGVMMTANKHADVRAALCWNAEIARMSRTHNDANVLCISQQWTPEEELSQIIDQFLSTAFESGGRHERRVNKINL